MIRPSDSDLILDRDFKMKVLYKLIIVIFLVGTSIFFNGAVYSADKKKISKMGMVDMTLVTRGSLLAKDIARKIDSKRRKFMNEIKTEEKSLRRLDDDLQKKRVILSSESFSVEKRKFNTKRAALNKMVQEKNQGLLEFRRISDVFWNKAMQVALTDIVEKFGYNFVLRFSPELILVRPMHTDITKLVLDQLNKNATAYTIAKPSAKTGN